MRFFKFQGYSQQTAFLHKVPNAPDGLQIACCTNIELTLQCPMTFLCGPDWANGLQLLTQDLLQLCSVISSPPEQCPLLERNIILTLSWVSQCNPQVLYFKRMQKVKSTFFSPKTTKKINKQLQNKARFYRSSSCYTRMLFTQLLSVHSYHTRKELRANLDRQWWSTLLLQVEVYFNCLAT